MTYEALLGKHPHVTIREVSNMPRGLSGLYYDDVVLLDKSKSSIEKHSILAEELGHHYTTTGNIIDQTKLNNRRQERRARSWGYENIVTLDKIVQAHKNLIHNKFELAEYLSITEDFLEEAIDRLIEKHGLFAKHHQYTICFEPLGVFEWFEYKNF
ncbi:ImmA/IrrE family metallo-endopeptidase [Halolactibacillus sp. JCM 19043]|uniref:ImmA/IrrE family metallo-endopeptidase n=1 Tax=Halolactibacillus sp. JCM 19043 TaxID=1460638 RepID=UPI00078596EF|nr:ImmA/IrrE family metallo-endopeptidase [Halolactibacillus sp. JCM 19043]